jgi:O-antigen/teichoic acid export membrane protein
MVNRSTQVLRILYTGIKIRWSASLLATFVLIIWVWGGGLSWLGSGDTVPIFNGGHQNSGIVDLGNLVFCTLSLLYLRGTVIKTSQDYFLATETLRHDFLSTLASQFVKLLVLLVFIHFNLGIGGVFLAFVISDLIYIVIAYLILARKIPSGNSAGLMNAGTWPERLNYVKQALPIGIATLLYSLGLQIDKFVLQWLRDAGDVGLFSAIYRVVTVTFLFIYPVINVLLPKMTRESGTEDASGLLGRYDRMGRILSLGLFTGIFILIMIAPAILKGFGIEFRESLMDFRLLIPDLYFVSMSFFFLLALTTRKKQKWVIVSGLVVLISNLVIDLVLVETRGVTGAVAGTVTSDILGCVILFAAFSREFGWINPFRFSGPAITGILVSVITGIYMYPGLNMIDHVSWGCMWGVAGMGIYCIVHPEWRKLFHDLYQAT